MTNAIQGLIFELEQEAASTRRMLERLPEEKLSWKPHAKSMSLGQLALHVASTPGSVANLLLLEGLDAKTVNFEPPSAKSLAEILGALEQGVSHAKEVLNGLTPEKASGPWKLVSGEREVFTAPRIGVARNIMLNHWYHHRGQLSVYMRLLDVPVPAIYGRSADENPMA